VLAAGNAQFALVWPWRIGPYWLIPWACPDRWPPR